MWYMAREHFSNLKFTVFIDIFLISILYPDEKEKKKNFVRIPLATKVKGEIFQQRLKFQTLQQEKISIFPKGYHCYC